MFVREQTCVSTTTKKAYKSWQNRSYPHHNQTETQIPNKLQPNPILPTYDLRQRQQNNEQSTPSHHSNCQLRTQQPASSDCINRRRNHALKCKLLCNLCISNLNHKPEVFIHSAWTRTRLSPSALLRLAASALRDHRQWTSRQTETAGTRRRTAEE